MKPHTRLLAAVTISAIGFVQLVSAGDARADDSKTGTVAIAQFEPCLSLSVLETRLLRDASDKNWDEHSLFAAALIASGVANEVELRGTCDLFAVVGAELNSKLAPTATAEQRAEKTLAFLHRRLLTNGYDLYATQLPRVLATGRYNCVSATVLFNCLAADAGLNVGALRLPNHTCTELLDGEQRIRIEATCASWFTDRDRPHTIDAVIGETPFVANLPPPSELQEAISDVALVAMIYYNRGVEALARKDYVQAISLNRRALCLDPHNTQARSNLLSAINKQALALAARNEFAAAMSVIDDGLEIDPAHQALRHNQALIDGLRRKAVDAGSKSGR
jgi:hypothetical protein